VGTFLTACTGGSSPQSAPGSAAAASTGAGGSTTAVGGGFTLDEGMEHDVCGIGISVKFIPSNASASKADEAVLMGGPVSNIQDLVQNHTGDQPLPANAAQATAGSTVAVVGKRFKVNAIDVAHTRVQLEPLC
jgi:hypothetical protein